MLRDDIKLHIEHVYETIDKLEILTTYLKWIVDNCPDEKLDDIKFTIQEISQSQSIPEHRLNSYEKILNDMYSELNLDGEISIDYFDDILKRIKHKISK